MSDRIYRRRDALAGGSGLGLAIAKKIAARCNATIVLGSSEDLGGTESQRVLRAGVQSRLTPMDFAMQS